MNRRTFLKAVGVGLAGPGLPFDWAQEAEAQDLPIPSKPGWYQEVWHIDYFYKKHKVEVKYTHVSTERIKPNKDGNLEVFSRWPHIGEPMVIVSPDKQSPQLWMINDTLADDIVILRRKDDE